MLRPQKQKIFCKRNVSESTQPHRKTTEELEAIFLEKLAAIERRAHSKRPRLLDLKITFITQEMKENEDD